MVTIINGKQVAKGLKRQVKEGVNAMSELGKAPGLVTILVGDNPASATYVGMKQRTCKRLGIYSKQTDLPANISQVELIHRISYFNAQEDIQGILVQLPLPDQISEYDIMDAVDPGKDVDGFSAKTIADICRGDDVDLPPCTPYGVIKLLQHYEIPLKGAEVAILGRSNIVGRPLANLLSRKEYSATVRLCHSRSDHSLNGDPEHPDYAKLKTADIVVAAIGIPKFLKPEMIREGAVVIDVGTNRLEDGSLCGDVDFDAVSEKCSYITPSPGGVGPMTIAMLMVNTYHAARRAYGMDDLHIIR